LHMQLFVQGRQVKSIVVEYEYSFLISL